MFYVDWIEKDKKKRTLRDGWMEERQNTGRRHGQHKNAPELEAIVEGPMVNVLRPL